ncbi:hypothetical protein LWI28_021931 [Acer negundo]|uniref:Putative plant transposon protein domain-containing protein n=1 Tax=Acer negundo TaxID=4023 RepID=A0AAD5NNT4_ACENE|nr:hypothetical protein LWI28_021931 [Acer negundo]
MEKLNGQKVIFERGIYLEDFKNTPIPEIIEKRNWQNFIKVSATANMSLVMEFYASICPEEVKKGKPVLIKGQDFQILAEKINTHFNTPNYVNLKEGYAYCEVTKLEQLKELRGLANDKWQKGSELKQSQLPQWLGFMNVFHSFSLTPVLHITIISEYWVDLLYSYVKDTKIDVGKTKGRSKKKRTVANEDEPESEDADAHYEAGAGSEKMDQILGAVQSLYSRMDSFESRRDSFEDEIRRHLSMLVQIPLKSLASGEDCRTKERRWTAIRWQQRHSGKDSGQQWQCPFDGSRGLQRTPANPNQQPGTSGGMNCFSFGVVGYRQSGCKKLGKRVLIAEMKEKEGEVEVGDELLFDESEDGGIDLRVEPQFDEEDGGANIVAEPIFDEDEVFQEELAEPIFDEEEVVQEENMEVGKELQFDEKEIQNSEGVAVEQGTTIVVRHVCRTPRAKGSD